MKHAVKIAHVFGDIERHARGVAHAADGEQGKCHGVEQRHELGQLKDNEPAHQQIDQAAYPMRLALAHKALEGDADNGDGPYGKEQRRAAVVCERDKAKRRIAARNEQVDAAVKAGAKFIVSPGFDPEIVDYCLKKEIPVLPGCISPSEVAQAVKRGLKTVKFFPAEQAGGVAMIKAMAAPYTGIKFMPTGGINAKNLEDYLSFDKIICCGGSWMVKGDLVKAGAFDKIKELTAEARNLVESIRK